MCTIFHSPYQDWYVIKNGLTFRPGRLLKDDVSCRGLIAPGRSWRWAVEIPFSRWWVVSRERVIERDYVAARTCQICFSSPPHIRDWRGLRLCQANLYATFCNQSERKTWGCKILLSYYAKNWLYHAASHHGIIKKKCFRQIIIKTNFIIQTHCSCLENTADMLS